MKAIVANEPLPSSDPKSLLDAEMPDPPAPTGHDMLVRVEAVSVNPVDTKTRMMTNPAAAAGAGRSGPRILGYDAAGIVEDVGDKVTLFRRGDAVYYAGSNQRPGSNAQKQLVDERIVGLKPVKLDFAQAAAMPLTSLTAYEGIVDRMGADPNGGTGTLLVIAGAGGVGSMAIQIGRKLGLEVIATASRPKSEQWCRDLGAAHVVNHHHPLKDGLKKAGMSEVDYVLICSDIDLYWTQLIDIVRPQGSICSIVRNEKPADIMAIQRKSLRFAWEGMFTRSGFQTGDMVEQHRLLNRVAGWLDTGELKCTMTEQLSPINAANLRAAHAKVESKGMIGKVVLSGW